MPGWILVANRFSLQSIIRRSGGLFSAIASLSCLVIVSGCSNMRQQSLELPLPILPSEVATATQTVDEEPVSTRSESAEDVHAKGSSTKSDLGLGQDSSSNDFVANEIEQSPSVQSFLSSGNDFQPQQPSARFVGDLDKAETTEIKLTANTEEAGPAPAIAKASNGR